MANFKPYDKDNRAQRRIEGEDVFGHKIKVVSPVVRNFSGQRLKNLDLSTYQNTHVPPPPGFSNQDFASNSYLYQQNPANLPPLSGYSSQDFPSTSQPWQNSFLGKKKPQSISAQSGIGNHMFRPVDPMEVTYEQSVGSKIKRASNKLTAGLSRRVHKTSGSSEFSDDNRIWEHESKQVLANQPVDLIISNLDPSIQVKELERLLVNMIKKYAMILHLKITVQFDGNPVAYLRVNSLQEAQFTISQLHKQKLGHKRILMAFAENNSLDKEQLKTMVISVLQEVPEKCLPLFQFIDLLESKYHCVVSVSDLNKLKDICKITDDMGTRRTICLLEKVKTASNILSCTLVPYCTVHCPNGLQNRGWCELNVIHSLSIMISLNMFTNKLMALLEAHRDCMHLLSFQACYEQEFQEPLPIDVNGVPLEHLVLCIPNMEIKLVGPNKNIKIIKYKEAQTTDTEEEAFLKTVPPSLVSNLNMFCRELVDLLKKKDKCQMLLSKFIPEYHHHYGKQCRVADYGYTKLIDLLESLTHVVQIMGDGTRRTITLSHSAQMRRFTSDLLKVLKVQPSKQISIAEFPAAYEKVMAKPFNPVEYGLCTFEDLLQEVSGNTVVISKSDKNITIAIPKREQTAEEIVRTKQFATEVIDLLRHSPYYRISFNKFVPAYHHHFGQQCRLSDYGFTKLIELFEAIPDVVKIEETDDGERTISLTQEQSLSILSTQIVQLIKSSPQRSIQLNDLPTLFFREYGYPLKTHLYECDTVEEFVAKLSNCIQVINSNACPLLIAIDLETVPSILGIRCWALLRQPPNCKKFDLFQYEYQCKYNSSFNMESLQQISHIISVSSLNGINFVSLTSLFILAAQLYDLIYHFDGTIPYNELERLYFETYGKILKLSSFNINSIDEFFHHFNSIFFFKQGKKKNSVMLNRNLEEHLVPLPPSFFKSDHMTFKAAADSMVDCLHALFEDTEHSRRKVSPPKPDTPPTPGCKPWATGNGWSTPVGTKNNLSIHLPIVPNPKPLGETTGLTSPTPSLKTFYKNNPWGIPLSPDPNELPMPDKLIGKNNIAADDSSDSGVNIRLENSPPDEGEETNGENLASGNEKPSFATVLKFNN